MQLIDDFARPRATGAEAGYDGARRGDGIEGHLINEFSRGELTIAMTNGARRLAPAVCAFAAEVVRAVRQRKTTLLLSIACVDAGPRKNGGHRPTKRSWRHYWSRRRHETQRRRVGSADRDQCINDPRRSPILTRGDADAVSRRVPSCRCRIDSKRWTRRMRSTPASPHQACLWTEFIGCAHLPSGEPTRSRNPHADNAGHMCARTRR
ncbi:hypothetical protein KCP78_15690 [Salmonella enterica subsp. enterica]|nr:hypothetical protein KCP78_15690 [Salmonella enterica subsp. enterica]